MRSLLARRHRGTVAAAAAVTVTLLAGATAAAPAAASARPAWRAGHRPGVIALRGPAGQPGQRVARLPLLARVRGWTRTGHPVLATGAPGGYTATELRAYLHLTGTGAGQTIAIVDAYDDPYAANDITTYSRQFGLPLPCTAKRTRNCFGFRVVHPFGIGGFDPGGWGVEESLDMEMAHALAPRASIVLVEAHDPANTAMFHAVGYAAGRHPAVISNSWGFGGEFKGETSDDHYCQLTAGLCTFSSGDSGNPGGYPAYNPAVIAAGGTSLQLTATGTVTSETAWSTESCAGGPCASGGGVSQYEPRPAYQAPVNKYQFRGIPDVSFDADPYTGVAVYDSGCPVDQGCNGWLVLGGTSVASPAWAGILAAADQLRAAAGKPALTAAGHEAQKALYGLATGQHGQPLYDITSGSNGTCGAICTAGPGYDFVTGLGSPRPGIDSALAAAP